MKALVTGSAGFVGRHFAHELRRRGWQVDGIDVSTMDYGTLDWELPANCGHQGTYVHGRSDVLDIFTSPIPTMAFDLVVHAAAQAPHRAAIDGQPATHIYNQLLDAAMFDWAVRTGQGRVLYLSSAAMYPIGYQAGHVPYRLAEGDAYFDQPVSKELLAALRDVAQLHPDASYGWTKLTGERLAASARAAGVPVTVVRPFSGYGEDQGTDWPFGAFADRARRRADPFTIWGDGTQVRDWVHIDDVVAGALAVVESGTEEPVNLCTGRGVSMLELAWLMCAEAGYEPVVEVQPGRPAGVAYRVGDPALMQKYSTPTVSIEDGVKRALAGG